jgi:RNA polymerase sigma-70 factor (ECF subfamily)
MEGGRPEINSAMERYADGDEAAFSVLYDALATRLYAFLVRSTRDKARAEDLVQHTFLHIHRARGSFIRGADVMPWAFSIARRLMIDHARRSEREIVTMDPSSESQSMGVESNAEELLATVQLAAQLKNELAQLPEPQRAAFQLVKQEGLSLAEAAAVLGTTTTGVKLRLHRAYAALRSIVTDGR